MFRFFTIKKWYLWSWIGSLVILSSLWVQVKIDVKINNNEINRFYQSGSAKVFYPKSSQKFKELVLVNTAGGITSGDNFSYDIVDGLKVSEEGMSIFKNRLESELQQKSLYKEN